MTHADQEHRGRQIAVGVGILLTVTALVCGTLIGWRYLPGLMGEWIGTMVGVATTPFFLEGSFVVLGVTIVVAINHWRLKRDGDELVYLEQVDETDLSGNLPDQAKWAVYKEAPLAGEVPSLLVAAQGALAIGDIESAAESIAAMSTEQLKSLEVIELRIALAKASGNEELAARLEHEAGTECTVLDK